MITAPMEAERREDVSLSDLIPIEEWAVTQRVIEEAGKRRLSFALGGGLAMLTYSGRWRNTKDVDLFIVQAERWHWIAMLGDLGFADYFDQAPYDRTWIYRGFLDGTILDLIWTMPNHRMQVDNDWLTRGEEVEIHGTQVPLLSPEEFLCSKLYVLQRDRCDWPDLLNVLRGYGCHMDWRRLFRRVGPDRPLLAGLVSVYGWLCGPQARELPAWVWRELGLSPPRGGARCDQTGERTFLLDTREWFGPTVRKDGLCA